MPPCEAFRDAESYYGTILHELVSLDQAPLALDRDLGQKGMS
jgi:antirestriction protein ArdC